VPLWIGEKVQAVSRPPELNERLHVMVGLLRDGRGRFLLNRRTAGQHMAGCWEFPGGKRNPGESRRAALARELDEELGITVNGAEPLLEIDHDYPDRLVRLDVWLVQTYSGTPRSRENQALRWVAVERLSAVGLLEADRPIVAALEAMTARQRSLAT
jgi:8-oxo-dGTP diphosphatase